MPALAIHRDLSAEELRRLARREPDRRAAMRLLAIANRCPVHLTLTSRIDIRTTLRAATQEQGPGGDPATS